MEPVAVSLWIVAEDSANGVANIAVTGNVLVGESSLSTLLRTGVAPPANTWSIFNDENS